MYPQTFQVKMTMANRVQGDLGFLDGAQNHPVNGFRDRRLSVGPAAYAGFALAVRRSAWCFGIENIKLVRR